MKYFLFTSLLMMGIVACQSEEAQLQQILLKAQSNSGACSAVQVGEKWSKQNQLSLEVAAKTLQPFRVQCEEAQAQQRTEALQKAQDLTQQAKFCLAESQYQQAQAEVPEPVRQKCATQRLQASVSQIQKLYQEGDYCSARNHTEKMESQHRPYPLKQLKQKCQASMDAIKIGLDKPE